MDLTNWLQFAINAILAIITGVYVYITKKILDTSIKQSAISSNPVIGINIKQMAISKVDNSSRRELMVTLKLTNVGNGPALDILIDAEVIYQYSHINGINVIPSRFEPGTVSFLKSGDEYEGIGTDPCFGNTCITYLIDDFREFERLNLHRIEVNPSRIHYNPSRVKIYVYYHNNLGQYFESTYETYIFLEKIPENDMSAELSQIYYPRPIFHAGIISVKTMDENIDERNSKRDLCGC